MSQSEMGITLLPCPNNCLCTISAGIIHHYYFVIGIVLLKNIGQECHEVVFLIASGNYHANGREYINGSPTSVQHQSHLKKQQSQQLRKQGGKHKPHIPRQHIPHSRGKDCPWPAAFGAAIVDFFEQIKDAIIKNFKCRSIPTFAVNLRNEVTQLAPKGNEKTLGELIEQLMDKWGHTPRLKEQDLQGKWEELMGKMIARHTKRLAVNNSKLYLEIDSPVVRHELSYGKTVIIEKVNELMGKGYISDVVFR
jgi:hypothetical protein